MDAEVEKYEAIYPALGVSNEIPTKIKPLESRERDTLLKLVIGMAIKGYRYDPMALKNTAIKDIVDDLADLGISIDTDTARKHLKAAVIAVLPAKPRQP